MALLLGPGLFVNYGLKGHFGRPRPEEIVAFGEKSSFAAPLVITQQGGSSFSCGDAAAWYYLSAITLCHFSLPEDYFFIGTFFGSVVGLGRIAQGKHFLSDVVFSGPFVMLINHLWFTLWKKCCGRMISRKKGTVDAPKPSF